MPDEYPDILISDLRTQLAKERERADKLELQVHELQSTSVLIWRARTEQAESALAEKERDRQYHMNAINKMAEAIGMLGETSDAIAEAVLTRVAKLAVIVPVLDAKTAEAEGFRAWAQADKYERDFDCPHDPEDRCKCGLIAQDLHANTEHLRDLALSSPPAALLAERDREIEAKVWVEPMCSTSPSCPAQYHISTCPAILRSGAGRPK